MRLNPELPMAAFLAFTLLVYAGESPRNSASAAPGEISPHKSLPGAPSEGQELPTNQRDRQAWALDIKLIPGSDRAIFHGEKPHISSHYGSYTLLHDVPIEMRAHQSNVGHDKIHVGRNKILSHNLMHMAEK